MAQLPVLTSLPAAIHSVNRAYPQVSSYLPAALGRSVSCFSRQLPVLYQDNSIQKETRLKRQSKAKASLLRRQTCIAQSRTPKSSAKKPTSRPKKPIAPTSNPSTEKSTLSASKPTKPPPQYSAGCEAGCAVCGRRGQ